MRTVAGAGAFNVCGDMPIVADALVCKHILLVTMFRVLVIEIRTEEITSIIGKDGEQADDIATIGVVAGEVIEDVSI